MNKIKTTNRGFDYTDFVDRNGEKCSLQKSSIATEDCIWLGVDNAKIFVEDPDTPGKYVILKHQSQFKTYGRMHLTREQVKNLLPYLINFAETGEINSNQNSKPNTN